MSALTLVSAYQIDRGIPMPPPCRGAAAKYPWREMEVGESFFVEASAKDAVVIRSRVRSAGYSQRLAHGTRFTVRTVEGGVRVWRIA